MMKCPNCGFENDEKSRECIICGTSFIKPKKEVKKQNSKQQPTRKEVHKQKRIKHQTRQTQNNRNKTTTKDNKQKHEKDKTKKTKLVCIIILLVVIISCVTVVIVHNNQIQSIQWAEFYTSQDPTVGEEATIYVGDEYAGKNVQVSIAYMKDGTYLNNETYELHEVNDYGRIIVNTTPMNQYPDTAIISLKQGSKIITETCYLNQYSGTQHVDLQNTN